MDNTRQFKQWGPLDVAARNIEELAQKYADSWNSGEYRMTPADCRLMATYLKRIKVSHSVMRDTLKLFESLANHEKAHVVIPKIIQHEKQVQQERTDIQE